MGFHLKIGAMTDVGKVRVINEDNFSVAEDLGLFMVAKESVGGRIPGGVFPRYQ
jgi:hypothetical protein